MISGVYLHRVQLGGSGVEVLSFRQVRPQVWGLPIRWWINKAKEDFQLFQALPDNFQGVVLGSS